MTDADGILREYTIAEVLRHLAAPMRDVKGYQPIEVNTRVRIAVHVAGDGNDTVPVVTMNRKQWLGALRRLPKTSTITARLHDDGRVTLWARL